MDYYWCMTGEPSTVKPLNDLQFNKPLEIFVRAYLTFGLFFCAWNDIITGVYSERNLVDPG